MIRLNSVVRSSPILRHFSARSALYAILSCRGASRRRQKDDTRQVAGESSLFVDTRTDGGRFVGLTAKPVGGRSRDRRPHAARWHTAGVRPPLPGSLTSLKLPRSSIGGVLHKHERFENQLNFARGPGATNTRC